MVATVPEGADGSRGRPADLEIAIVRFFLRMERYMYVVYISCGLDEPTRLIV